MRRPIRTALLLFGATLMTGCFAVTDYDDISESQEETFTLPYVQNLDGFDILFVVDTADSTNPVLLNVGEAAPGMINSLDFAMDGLQAQENRLHIGVISPDLGTGVYANGSCDSGGDEGELRTAMGAGCPPLLDTHLVVVDNEVQNLGEMRDVSIAVQCLIDGQRERLSSCDFGQPLAAVAKAMDLQQTPMNQGFFRPDAGLAVVLMTKHDDCSTPTDALFDPNDQSLGQLSSFRCFEWGVLCDEDPRTPGAKTNCRPRESAEGGLLYEPAELANLIFAHRSPADMVFAVVSQPSDPVVVALDEMEDPYVMSACGEGGVPGVRLQAFLRYFNDLGLDKDVCQPQVSDLMFQISELMANQAVSRCMPKPPADMDKETVGLQAECTAWDVVNLGQIDEVRSEDILSCEVSAPPCWRLVEDQICTSSYKMELERQVMAPVGSIVEATCRVLVD